MYFKAILASTCILWSSLAPAAETGMLRGRFVVDVRVPVGIMLFDGDLRISRDSGVAGCGIFMVGEKEDPVRGIIPPVSLVANNGELEPRLLFAKPAQALMLFNAGQTPATLDLAGPASQDSVFLNPGQRSRVEIPQLDHRAELRVAVDGSTSRRRATVFIQENPYFATSNADGYFEIANVPVGTHKFAAVHTIVRASSLLCPAWNRGIVSATIKANEPTDLGTIHILPKTLKIPNDLWAAAPSKPDDAKNTAEADSPAAPPADRPAAELSPCNDPPMSRCFPRRRARCWER